MHTTDQTLGMDLKQQLEASIQAMKGGKYEGAADLFEKLDKEEISRSEYATAAYDWVFQLSQVLAFASIDETILDRLYTEFESKESVEKEQFIDVWVKKTKDLLKKVTTAQNRLEEQGEKKVDYIYKPVSFNAVEDLDFKEYEDIGKYFTPTTSTVIKEMTDLTGDTYEKVVGFPAKWAPSFIVCSSSGTGKTQLPFSLNIPLLYFCCENAANPTNPTNSQQIYTIYSEISEYFMKLLNADFLMFIKALKEFINNNNDIEDSPKKQDTKNSSKLENSQPQQKVNAKKLTKDEILGKIAEYSLNCFTIRYLRKVPCKYRSISFLIKLIEKIRAIEAENERSSRESGKKYSPTIWPKLQLSLKDGDEIIPDEQTINESKEILYKMYSGKTDTKPEETSEGMILRKSVIGSEKESKESKRDPKFNLPLIFLDEFNVNSDTDPKSKAMFAFYRNIIRTCWLIPVLMGTNSQITNVITAGTASGSKEFIWAHIFYQLPEYPQKLFNENVHNVEGLSPQGCKVLKSLYPFLKKERPLFVQSIFKNLSSYLRELDTESKSIIPWFRHILSKFRSAFSVRKSKNFDNFYAHQVQFFLNAYKYSYNTGKTVCPTLIHSHLAYLTPPAHIDPECTKSYFDIYQIGETVQYQFKNENSEGFRKYKPNARFPKFEEEPFTCMAFSQNNSEYFCSFRNYYSFEKPSECFTAFQAFTQGNTISNDVQSNCGVPKEFDGSKLEQIVSVAFMTSSHTKFLEGMPFEEWFKYFIQQLACYTSNKFEKPKSITFDSKFKLKNFIVPYFAFDCAKWPKRLLKLLKNDVCYLGTYSGAFRESRDLSATTELYKGDFGFKSKKLKISKRKQDSKNEQDLVDEGFPDDGQDSDNEKDIMEISSLGKFDKTEAGESEEMEYLQHNSNSNDQAVQMQPGTSKTRKRRGLSIDSSEQIAPKSTEMFRKGSGRRKILSVECKLHQSKLFRSHIKKIILKMKSAGLQSKFNFIIAPNISDEIEFFFDPEYKVKEERINRLKKQEKSSNLTNRMEQLTLNPNTVEDSAENIPDEEPFSEVKQLETHLEDKLPYDDISIFRLKRDPSEFSNEIWQHLNPRSYYTCPRFELKLVRVYNWDIVPEAVFILIDLTEIHGAKHLDNCTMYFTK